MQNRTPTAPNGGAPLPAFDPVPRKCARHDGWTPARQRAFIEALADTGSVSRAAAQVNMSPEGDEPLFEIRDRIDKLARRASVVFQVAQQ